MATWLYQIVKDLLSLECKLTQNMAILPPPIEPTR